MKKFFLFSLAALFAAVSCQKQENNLTNGVSEKSGEGMLTLEVLSSDIGTKAAPHTNESTLTDIQVLLMRAEGTSKDELYRYCAFTSAEIAAKKCTVKNLKVGRYNIFVIANGPDLKGVRDLSEFRNTAVELGSFNSPSSDFVMSGELLEFEVKAGVIDTCEVELSRFVSRVTLSKIENNLPEAYGAMKVNYVVLSNVVGSQTLAADTAAQVWYNKDCRADEEIRVASHFIGIPTGVGSEFYKASCEELTFRKVADSVALGDSLAVPMYFYGYPDTSVRKGDGFENPFLPKATSLDISISFNGKTYYYNVPVIYENGAGEFAGMERNCNYEVRVKISGEGEDEPGKFTKKGSITATIKIKEWSDVFIPEFEI